MRLCRGGLDSSEAAGALPSFTTFFHVELPLLSWPVGILPILPGSAQTHCPMKPSCIHLSSYWVPKALFISLISQEGPVLFCSNICTCAHASLNSWGVRTVHQALCWTLTLIISNPHSYNPAIQEVLAPFHSWGNWDWVRSHHWSEGGQLLNRRVGIWTSSCQFRVFCCFTSGCPSGDWRAYLKWRQH